MHLCIETNFDSLCFTAVFLVGETVCSFDVRWFVNVHVPHKIFCPFFFHVFFLSYWRCILDLLYYAICISMWTFGSDIEQWLTYLQTREADSLYSCHLLLECVIVWFSKWSVYVVLSVSYSSSSLSFSQIHLLPCCFSCFSYILLSLLKTLCSVLYNSREVTQVYCWPIKCFTFVPCLLNKKVEFCRW